MVSSTTDQIVEAVADPVEDGKVSIRLKLEGHEIKDG